MPTTTTTKSSSQPELATQLAKQLVASQSTTIFLDLPDMDDAGAAALLSAELHVQHDDVRGLWAVRWATEDEIADAAVPKSTGAAASTSSSTPASSTSSTT